MRIRASARSGSGEFEGGSSSSDDEKDEELERAMGMDGSIPRTSDEFLRRISSRAYDMRRHLNQTLDSSSYDGNKYFFFSLTLYRSCSSHLLLFS